VIVTLRHALADDARRIHDLVDELLDGEDGLIVLIDGRRVIIFAEGFGLSPCSLNSWRSTSSGRSGAWGERNESREERGGHKMKKSTVLAIALALVSIWVMTAAGVTAGRWTEEVRVVGLVTLPTALIASLLVLYFDWRAKLQRRILVRRDRQSELAMDDALAGSFPASDPPAWNPAMVRPTPARRVAKSGERYSTDEAHSGLRSRDGAIECWYGEGSLSSRRHASAQGPASRGTARLSA
jgi:hypothetical protein